MAKRRVGVEYPAVNAGAHAPWGGVTRQGVVLTDLQSLRDCQYNFTFLSLSLSPHPHLSHVAPPPHAGSSLCQGYGGAV
jgi:hypothetical protein